MRDTFISALTGIAEQDERVVLITGDLGFKVFDNFRKKHADQFINAGIAEQSMAGIATGMALEGYTVFLYSIANFTFMRCLEQLRNDAAYHECNINVVSVGGGFSYGQLGMSHHATEDLAIMRCMPTSVVASPSELWEVTELTRVMYQSKGLSYLRLDKSNFESEENQIEEHLTFGSPRVIRDGCDVTLVATGGVVTEVIEAADALLTKGISACVISAPFIKPIDISVISSSAKKTGALFTIEEHSVLGGLGSVVAEELMENGSAPAVFRRIGLREKFTSVVGDQRYLRHTYGMSAKNIVAQVCDQLMLKRQKKAA